jgi:hypothetical protein
MSREENEKMGKQSVQVTVPVTPGATPSVVATVDTVQEARAVARTYAHRRDLRSQDVRIETIAGKLIEYAGPCR